MKRIQLIILALPLMLTACQSMGDRDTIAKLRHMKIDIKEEKIEGGLEKAMQSYQHFLEETPESALTPEAIRRLADLKIEKEYGTFTEGDQPAQGAAAGKPASEMTAPAKAALVGAAGSAPAPPEAQAALKNEDDETFEKRATQSQSVPATAPAEGEQIEAKDDLERAGPLEAIALYKKLLEKYPLYNRNDQVLYQMSRAYEELGRIDEAMVVMERLVRQYPHSRYIDEVQFRRAEYFFTRRKYLDAEDAYKTIVDLGVSSTYYELALYKLGWTFYKQEMYEDAQHRFIALLDHKVSSGYDFEQTEDETERKRTDDTFRVISLGFSNLGGADSVVAYFSKHGKRSYEDNVYSNLAEFYFDKRRYADASASYNAFVSRNPFHKKSPNFHMRVIEIHTAGGFPTLVLDAKKAFARTYGLKAEYWKYFDPSARQDVLDNLKTNLTDLAHHYHAAYQKPRKIEEKQANYNEALHWYREFLASFPAESESPGINYQLADLLLENLDYGQAAVEYEKTAYNYPTHEKSSEAGYAAVYALRKQLEKAAPDNKNTVKLEIVRISIKFVDTFPQHKKAAIVLGAAAEDLFAMKDYQRALGAGTRLIKNYPAADVEIVRTAWLVSAHSSYELQQYKEAEVAYIKVLELLPANDKTRDGLVDNLAASIYKQGEQANAAQDYRAAADHFLRVGRIAPTSTIRASAEYDGAAALIQLKAWDEAATVLNAFRKGFPGHKLQPEVTKKIAYVYKENGQLSLAAKEYERIETESTDDAIRQDALQVAADLYAQDGNPIKALEVYRRYVAYFPQPVELNLETRNKIADILKAQNDRPAYLQELRNIVAIDASAGSARTPRTIYLAGKAALVLAETTYDSFVTVKLVKPFQVNLAKKKDLMKKSIKKFNSLMDYELGEITAAATYYLAEIYAHFSQALMTSERPEGLSPLELEQYELVIEEQAYPFEEKGIEIHESNLKLISQGVYNEWIDKSLQKLAKFIPARYDKPEEASAIVSSLDTFEFATAKPAAPVPQDSKAGAAANAQPAVPTQAGEPATVAATQSGQLPQAGESEPDGGAQTAVPPQADESATTAGTQSEQPTQTDESEPAGNAQTAAPAQAAESATTAGTQSEQPPQDGKSEPDGNAQTAAPAQAAETATTAGTQSEQPPQDGESEPDGDAQTAAPAQADESATTAGTQSEQPPQDGESESDGNAQTAAPAQADESATTAKTQSEQPPQDGESEPDGNAQTAAPAQAVESATTAETQSEQPPQDGKSESAGDTQTAAPAQADESATTAETQSELPRQDGESKSDGNAQTAAPAQADESATTAGTQSEQPRQDGESKSDGNAQTAAPAQADESATTAKTQSEQPRQDDESEPAGDSQTAAPAQADESGSAVDERAAQNGDAQTGPQGTTVR